MVVLMVVRYADMRSVSVYREIVLSHNMFSQYSRTK